MCPGRRKQRAAGSAETDSESFDLRSTLIHFQADVTAFFFFKEGIKNQCLLSYNVQFSFFLFSATYNTYLQYIYFFLLTILSKMSGKLFFLQTFNTIGKMD